MTPDIRYFELSCPACSWSETCGPPEVVAWMLRARKIRDGAPPEPEILCELFLAAASALTCPECGGAGLAVAEVDDGGDWPEPAACQGCGRPIPAERLEVLPGAELCAACQQDEEQGRGPKEVDYCPRCGSPMEVRASRGAGITRYLLVCTAIPRCRGS
ncbi:MAG: TraR/DksA C4-type zinc finger protein [Planctomycetes bacterium]|nr:TraR/DksA C4-type zinc finger protein [Planctomycetota bacterium]